MTNNTTAVSAPLPDSMFNRGGEERVNIMESIHSMKIYNAAPNQVADMDLEGNLMIKNSNTDGRYVKFTKEVNINILKVKKAINGSYPLRDEKGETIKDNSGNAKREFAFTEEYGRFTRNTDEIYFKNKNQVVRTQLGELKNLIKTPEIKGVHNPFYKPCTDFNGDSYNGSHLRDSYIIYGMFLDGEYAGEYFRLFLSNSSFGITWRKQAKCDPDEGTLAYALAKGFNIFNKYKEENGISGSYDDSYITMKLGAKLDGKFYKANFTDISMINRDNTSDFEFINNLISEYKQNTFGSVGGEYATLDIGDNRTLEGSKSQEKSETRINTDFKSKINSLEEDIDEIPF